jgi:hypothetical protein
MKELIHKQLSWSYWKARHFRAGVASCFKDKTDWFVGYPYQELGVTLPDVCLEDDDLPPETEEGRRIVQKRTEELLKNAESIFEEALQSFWQRRIKIRLTIMRHWSTVAWRQLSCRKRSLFFKKTGLDEIVNPKERMPEWESSWKLIKAACFEHEKNVIEPLWEDLYFRHRKEIFNTLLVLARKLASVLQKLCSTGSQTALALRERKLLCTSRGGLANEQHFYSIFIAHLSTIAFQLAGKALVENITGNPGGKHYAVA